MEYITRGPEETRLLGQRLAEALFPGAVVAFTGDLGAGKTAFVSGMARGLGIDERVTSPTFTIVNEYEGGRLRKRRGRKRNATTTSRQSLTLS